MHDCACIHPRERTPQGAPRSSSHPQLALLQPEKLSSASFRPLSGGTMMVHQNPGYIYIYIHVYNMCVHTKIFCGRKTLHLTSFNRLILMFTQIFGERSPGYEVFEPSAIFTGVSTRFRSIIEEAMQEPQPWNSRD